MTAARGAALKSPGSEMPENALIERKKQLGESPNFTGSVFGVQNCIE